MAKTFRGVGGSRLGKTITDLMRYIASEGKTNIGEIHRKFYSDANKGEVEDMLKQLQAMKYCKMFIDTGEIIYTKEEKDGELSNSDTILSDSVAGDGDGGPVSDDNKGVQEEGS